jgi:LmbE family N-acetylglucosaminyl deacetylase
MRTLLGVWAHPDDEAYLSAGLMAQARRVGARVVVVTATAGELGTDDPVRWPPERLGALRRHELRASLAALDVREHMVLGMPDGGLHRLDGTRTLAGIIDAVRPDTIVTFGPDGMTGHADHQAISAWTTAARRMAAPHARLWYATVTADFHEEWGDVNEDIDLFGMGDGSPPCAASGELAHHVVLDDPTLDQKLVALRAHASQTAGLIEQLGVDLYREWWRTESFADADRMLEGIAASITGALVLTDIAPDVRSDDDLVSGGASCS